MKAQVDIVTGFLDSGKTTFINGMLDKAEESGERTLIIQCEQGEEKVDRRYNNGSHLFIRKLEKGRVLDEELLESILDKYYPDRVILECNGMAKLDDTFSVLECSGIRRRCRVKSVVNTIDATTFDVYMANMGPVLTDQIAGSDLIVLNKADGFEEEKLDRMEKSLKALNRSAEVVRGIVQEGAADISTYGESQPEVQGKRYSSLLFYLFIAFVLVYLAASVLRSVGSDAVNLELPGLQVFSTVFLSILMQAIPFILVGVFVSSVIQIIIPNETMVRLFPKSKGLGFITAMLSGVFFPVCDCAIVPVAARLVKKGVPLPAAVTFMLSAPIVNPIVIASTIYAFPSQPSIAVLRVVLGLLVALSVGLYLQLSGYTGSVLQSNADSITCRCGFCSDDIKGGRGFGGKLQSVFKHAGAEFFEVGKFLIIGALLSSVMQTFVPKSIFDSMRGQHALSLAVMMLAAFVFSVCSTSDAFIGRTFLNQFSINSVMGFLILGPMVDIKNVLMLLSSFKKSFVAKLVALIFVFAFALIYILAPMLM